jgi:tetratricopeptide (TPR) repeat protein
MIHPELRSRLCRARDLLRDWEEDEPLSITAIARASGLTPFHFIRLFKAIFGETPLQTLSLIGGVAPQMSEGLWKPVSVTKVGRFLSIVSVVFLLSVGKSFGEPRYNAYDVSLHLQKCTHRPVFFERQVGTSVEGRITGNTLVTDTLPSCDKDSIVAWLAQRGLSLVWEDSLLLIKRTVLPDPPYIRQVGGHPNDYWTHLKLETVVRGPTNHEFAREEDLPEDYKYIPVQRNLRDEELKRAGDWVLKNVPMPPAPRLAHSPSDPPETATLQLCMVLQAVKMAQDAPEKIIGWIGAKNYQGNLPCYMDAYAGGNRIIVAHIDGDTMHLQWMSPLLNPIQQDLFFRDVNADGVAEIWSFSAFPAGNFTGQVLSIFDLNGRELTRDAEGCGLAYEASFSAGSTPASACPIPGSQFLHQVEEDGSVSLVVDRGIHGWADEADRTYRLTGGKYVWVNKPTAEELHNKGLEAFRNKQYGTAASRFEEAATLDPNAAQYANDAGFAYYKMATEMQTARPDAPSVYKANFERAVALFQKAIEIDPKRAVAYLNLGDAYIKLNRSVEARQAYTKYLELVPDSKSAPDVKKKLDTLTPSP